MAMRITRLEEAEPFEPVGHKGVGPVRLQGGPSTPTTDFAVTLSHFLPGGSADTSAQIAETVYVVLDGELVMISEGREETVRAHDSVHFTVGTERSVENRSHLPASMIVIRSVT